MMEIPIVFQITGKKLFFFDCETTGLNNSVHDILTLSYIVDIDNKVMTAGTLKIRPENPSQIDSGALLVNGLTLDQINGFDDPEKVHTWLCCIFARYIDKYNPADKFYPVAFNGQFDYSFLVEFFKRRNDKYLNSYLSTKVLDPLPIFRFFDYLGVISLPSYKLKNIAEFFGIELQAHNSASDVSALRQIFYRTLQIFNRGY